MKLGILGGTFDPIHVGHLIVAELLADALDLERVLFTPAAKPPHKQHLPKTATRHRCRMVELAIGGNDRFELCPVDLNRPGPHYSVDTVSLIRRQYDLPADACYFIIGGDSLVDLPTWHQPEKLVQLCRLATVHRPGYRPDLTVIERAVPGVQDRLSWVETPLLQISSSQIRASAAGGRTIRYQVPETVRAYIEQHNLYR